MWISATSLLTCEGYWPWIKEDRMGKEQGSDVLGLEAGGGKKAGARNVWPLRFQPSTAGCHQTWGNGRLVCRSLGCKC